MPPFVELLLRNFRLSYHKMGVYHIKVLPRHSNLIDVPE